MPEAGWLPDPDGTPRRERYHDGTQWTTRTRSTQRPATTRSGAGSEPEARTPVRRRPARWGLPAALACLVVVAVALWQAPAALQLLNPPIRVTPSASMPSRGGPPGRPTTTAQQCTWGMVSDLGSDPEQVSLGPLTLHRPGPRWLGPDSLAVWFTDTNATYTLQEERSQASVSIGLLTPEFARRNLDEVGQRFAGCMGRNLVGAHAIPAVRAGAPVRRGSTAGYPFQIQLFGGRGTGPIEAQLIIWDTRPRALFVTLTIGRTSAAMRQDLDLALAQLEVG